MIELGRTEHKLPPEIEELILRSGGINPYGEPNFKIVWGETYVTRTGFGDMRLFPIPAWVLLKWEPPEKWGSPDSWDYEALGAYPHRGMYNPVQPFYERIDKKIVPMEMSRRVAEFIMYTIMAYECETPEKRLAVMKAMKEKDDKIIENRIADNLQDAVGSIAVDGISFVGQTNCRSYVQQMMDRIESQMGQSIAARKGLQQLS
jgi:hypothetical protein